MEPEKPIDERELIAAYKRRLPKSILKKVLQAEHDNGELDFYQIQKIVECVKEDKRLRHEYLEAEREQNREVLRSQRIRTPYNAGRNAALCRGDEQSRKLHRSGRNREQRGELRGRADKRTMRVD